MTILTSRFPSTASGPLPLLLLLLCLGLGCLIPGSAAATCGYGPFDCPATYLPVGQATPCTTCGTQECCKVGFGFSTVTPSPNFSPSRWVHCMVTVSSQLLVIGGLTVDSFVSATGYLNDSWSSSTGSSWVQRTAAAGFSARGFHSCPVAGSTVFLIAGYNGIDLNDVWSSTDIGATFTQVTAAAAFPPRDSFGAVFFNNALWVVAGYSNGIYLNDVWSSTTNGVTWSVITPVGAIFSGRTAFGIVVFSGQIWMAGGENANTIFNEVWSTSNGASWTNVPQVVPMQPRTSGVLIAFNDVMLFAGGSTQLFTSSTSGTSADTFATRDGSSWTKSASLPVPLQGFGCSVLGYAGFVTGGKSGALISAAQYAATVSPTCLTVNFNCPVVYSRLNPYTLCSGTTCTQADCCSSSLGARSTKFAAIVLAVASSLYTPVTFAQAIQRTTGIPSESIVVSYLASSSLTVYLTVVASTPALADAALALIVQAALSGLLGPVISVTFVDAPFPPPASAYPQYPTVPIFRPPSTSNPALLALLTLLVIPLAICLGLICSYARRPRCMVPVSCAAAPIAPYCGAF